LSPDLERFKYERAGAKITLIPKASHAVYISHPEKDAAVTPKNRWRHNAENGQCQEMRHGQRALGVKAKQRRKRRLLVLVNATCALFTP
jgi:hypothetical protein